MSVRLGSGAEFDLIRALAARWGALAVGLGDDASLLTLPRGEKVVVSTDAAVEGVHFTRDWLTLREIGYRAAAAALSDLAAMAATPLGVLLAFTTSPTQRDELLDVADGVADAVRQAGTRIVGGNLSAGPALSITTTVIGSAYAPISRAGARAGDGVYVTGQLGGPAAAIRALRARTTPRASHRARLAAPMPRLREARWLAARGLTAAIDISDGLARDAEHLAAASAVSMRIEVERIPVAAEATIDDALGGEEYELLITLPDADEAEFQAHFDVALTRIGSIVAAETEGSVAFLQAGQRVAVPESYDHFSR